MKKYLFTGIIFLICFSAFSQIDSYPHVIYSNDIRKAAFLEASITVNLLKRFQEECYNDSTLIMTTVYKRSKKQTFASNNMEVDYYEVSNPPKYSHKKPTFDNFLEWLNKKYNL